MRILLYERQSGEMEVVTALAEGMRRLGEECVIRSKREYDAAQLEGLDLVVTGRIAASMHIMDDCRARGVDVLYFDKGYFGRGWKQEAGDPFFRFAINDYHPTAYFQDVPRPSDRWESLGIPLHKRRKNGKHVVFAGCSRKFARLYDFEITEYATRVIAEIKRFTELPVVYRPKRGPEEPPKIPGTSFSDGARNIQEELENAYALVTFSSNAAADAIVAGVPAFVLGPGIAKPVSGTDLSTLPDPYFPPEDMRRQWCYDVAYCRWTLREMKSGEAWKDVKKTLERLRRSKKT